MARGNPAFFVYENSQYWLTHVKTSFLHPRIRPSPPNTRLVEEAVHWCNEQEEWCMYLQSSDESWNHNSHLNNCR